MEHPGDSSKAKSKKVTASDLPGSGGVRKAGDAITNREKSNKSALDMAMAAVGRKKKPTKNPEDGGHKDGY